MNASASLKLIERQSTVWRINQTDKMCIIVVTMMLKRTFYMPKSFWRDYIATPWFKAPCKMVHFEILVKNKITKIWHLSIYILWREMTPCNVQIVHFFKIAIFRKKFFILVTLKNLRHSNIIIHMFTGGMTHIAM